MKYGSLAIIALLLGCSADERAISLTCRATAIYNHDGPDEAIEAFEDLGQEQNYIVANNLARYLILRGSKTSDKNDFDRAYSILVATKMPARSSVAIVNYITMLKFIAIRNGSGPKSVDPAALMGCAASVSKASCAARVASDALSRLIFKDGSKSRTTTDLLEIYARTHLAAFGSPFVLELEEPGIYADELTSCASKGVEAPGTSYSAN